MKSDQSPFPKMPGLDFLRSLTGAAAKPLDSGLHPWLAPTLEPEALEKRIDELKTVQFWLEQNARLLGATIQALEVQKMTLSTLRSMNVPMPDLQRVFTAMMPTAPEEPTGSNKSAKSAKSAAGTRPPAAGPHAPMVDPMKWWASLSEQFQQIASGAAASAAQAAGSPPERPAAGKGTGGARAGKRKPSARRQA